MPIYYFYPIIIALTIVTSFTDIKTHLIKNKHLLFAITASLFVYAYLFVSGKLKPTPLLLLNPLLALGIGFALYWTKTWGAGDAKLFTTYAILLPANRYSHIFYFPCFSMFLNIFLISTVFILLFTLNQILSHRKTILKDVFSLKTVKLFSFSLAIMFSITWVVWPLIHSINVSIPLTLLCIILFLLYKIIFKLFSGIKSNRALFILVCIAGVLLRYFFQPDSFRVQAILQYIKSLLAFTVLFIALEAILKSLKTEQDKKTANNNKPSLISFAPFMGIGALTANTHIIALTINIINSLKI